MNFRVFIISLIGFFTMKALEILIIKFKERKFKK
jgi:hypothetical protein